MTKLQGRAEGFILNFTYKYKKLYILHYTLKMFQLCFLGKLYTVKCTVYTVQYTVFRVYCKV